MTPSAPLSAPAAVTSTAPAASPFHAFIEKADFYRFGWSAAVALIQGCLLTPALLLSTFVYGGPDGYVLAAFLCFLGVLIPILSALPIRYVFGGFAISFVVHVLLIATNLL